MELAEIVYELKRLSKFAETNEIELASAIYELADQYDVKTGDCCG